MLAKISSEYPFTVKINGIFHNTQKNTLTTLDLLDGVLVEIIPLESNILPTSFLFDDLFRKTPDKFMVKTNLKDAFFINLIPNRLDTLEKTIKENSCAFGGANVSVKNGINLTVYNKYSIYTESFYEKNYDNVKIEFIEHNSSKFSIIRVGRRLNVYMLDGKIEKVLSVNADEVYFDNGLKTVTYYKDIAKHKVSSYYQYVDKKLKPVNFQVEISKKFYLNGLPLKVLPVAFFEGLMHGDDLSTCMTEEIFEKKDKLKGYLKDYVGVLPCPSFRNNGETGLIYKIDDNLYEVKYCRVEFKDRKISNLCLID